MCDAFPAWLEGHAKQANGSNGVLEALERDGPGVLPVGVAVPATTASLSLSLYANALTFK